MVYHHHPERTFYINSEERLNEEYAGYLEAQFLGSRLLAIWQNKEWMQQQTRGRDINEEYE